MFRKIKLRFLPNFPINYTTRVSVDANLRDSFETNEYKPRKHPGTAGVKIAKLPLEIQKAIRIVCEDSGAKALYQDAIKLNNYLRSRLLPPEVGEINLKAEKIHNTITKNALSNQQQTEAQLEKIDTQVRTKVFNILKKNVYGWGNISYDKATCLQYLMLRAAPEYAILVRIFDEIRKRMPDYKPRSFFDFGSGVGTGTWAINTYWKGDIFEYFCVDTSAHMNDLCRLILCSGKSNVVMPYKAYFQRQFLPASTDLRYNIVLSAFTLFEMPNMKSRLETIQKLWNKTEDFLIIVEHGSNAGFKIVNEAREFVLNSKKGSSCGYAFSPCPNDNVCPRYLEQATPCNFLMKYESLQYPTKSEVSADVFSYVVLRKGARPPDDPQWPRVVRAPIVRSGHTICKLCTAQGELKEVIFSKSKFDKTTYRCARSCNWGDELPVK